MAVADDDVHTGAFCCVDHSGARVERKRHRLFDQQMFAVLCRKRRVLRVVLMRGRDIDRLDVRIGAQRLDGCVSSGAKIRRQNAAGLRAAGPRPPPT